MLEDKPFDRELLELFGAFLNEVRTAAEMENRKFEMLQKSLRERLKNFPERFASGAEAILHSLEKPV